MVGQYGLKCCQPNGGGLTFLIAYDCLVFVLFFWIRADPLSTTTISLWVVLATSAGPK